MSRFRYRGLRREAELHSPGGAGCYLEREGMKGRKGQEEFYLGD